MVRSASENSGNGGEAGDLKMSASSYELKILGSQYLIDKLKILKDMCITREHQQVICGNSLRPSHPVSAAALKPKSVNTLGLD